MTYGQDGQAPSPRIRLVTTPLITCTSHILYARRIHDFKKREGSRHIHFWSISLAVVVALSVTHVVAALFSEAFLSSHSVSSEDTQLVTFSLPSPATTDLILRVWEVHISLKQLIQFGVGANLLTSILQILELILFLASPDTAYHFAVLIFISKTYIIGQVLICRVFKRGISTLSSLLAVITQARAWSSSSHDNGSIGTPNYRIQHNAPDFETEVAHQTSTEPNFVEMALRVQTGRKFATETQG
ncbi:hypothetical protein BT69DRAFT_1295245 [Atractiella rhizophila]|nr:hypothetical protein BT69DRAFT_1295245 [Atractiella rhizophila]